MIKEDFDKLMETYKVLPLDVKKDELIKKNKEIISMLLAVGELYNKKIEILYNKEISDLNNSDYTEDDYIEALYSYTYMLENAIVQLLEK